MQEQKSPSEIRSSLIKYAAFCLSRQPYFYSRLQQKLVIRAQKLKFADSVSIISDILSDLQKSGYLDDVYLAGSFVRGQLEKYNGVRAIRFKLKQFNLDETVITKALEEATEEKQIEIAQKYIQKYSKLDPRKVKSKLYQRGFPSEIINKVFDSRYNED